MRRLLVLSSHVKSVGYDGPSKVLEVEFKDSGIYQYLLVPRRIFEGLIAAQSKGTYLNEHIKDAFEYLHIG